MTIYSDRMNPKQTPKLCTAASVHLITLVSWQNLFIYFLLTSIVWGVEWVTDDRMMGTNVQPSCSSFSVYSQVTHKALVALRGVKQTTRFKKINTTKKLRRPVRELKQNKQAQLAASVSLWSLKAQSIQSQMSLSKSLHSLNKVPLWKDLWGHLDWI